MGLSVGVSSVALAQPDEEEETTPGEEEPGEPQPEEEPEPVEAEPEPEEAEPPPVEADEPKDAPTEEAKATVAGKSAEAQKPTAATAKTDATEEKKKDDDEEDKLVDGSFHFGSYGRVIAATDARGRPGRNVDIVAYGSRLDHSNYVELELRREDHWYPVDADTRVVATLALGHPIFHYNGEFDAKIAVRNLFIEEKGLGVKGLSIWAGSRMLRGDDIYVLDFWPLDNQNTLGAGIQYDAKTKTSVRAHVGMSQPNNPFYKQQSLRPAPLNQFGAATVDVLDRQQWTGTLRAQQIIDVGERGGIKLVAYGEAHQIPAGERETEQEGVFEDVPKDDGYVVGGQVSAFTGVRDTHVNLYIRYATGIAAYGGFANPTGLGPDETVSGAHELLGAVGGNWEVGPFAMMAGAYFRSFRNASEDLDFGDVDEGIVLVRPQIFFVDWAGVAVEGSFQAQQRGVLSDLAAEEEGKATNELDPHISRVARVGVVPFITPAGPGSYKRPIFWFIYTASFRDAGARALYPVDDPFNVRKVDHFIGIGAEWWFSSTSYFRGQ
jgi:maltoporin